MRGRGASALEPRARRCRRAGEAAAPVPRGRGAPVLSEAARGPGPGAGGSQRRGPGAQVLLMRELQRRSRFRGLSELWSRCPGPSCVQGSLQPRSRLRARGGPVLRSRFRWKGPGAGVPVPRSWLWGILASWF